MEPSSGCLKGKPGWTEWKSARADLPNIGIMPIPASKFNIPESFAFVGWFWGGKASLEAEEQPRGAGWMGDVPCLEKPLDNPVLPPRSQLEKWDQNANICWENNHRQCKGQGEFRGRWLHPISSFKRVGEPQLCLQPQLCCLKVSCLGFILRIKWRNIQKNPCYPPKN